jgi:uncharacterized protein with ParB-like and HNH nuclease domain
MNSPVGLDSLFKEKIFRIPDYQRGYAWQKPQYKDFWEDLINLQPKKSHYTGVITLTEIPTNKIAEDSKEYWLVEDHSYKVYHIVDGQQRLTSCIIFLQSLVEFVRSIPENEGKEDDAIYITDSLTLQAIIEKFIYKQKPSGDKFLTYKFGYTNDNPSYNYMRYRIFNEPNAGTIEETFYTLNLKNAKAYFIGQLEALYDEEGMGGIQEVYKKLSKHFLFNEYVIKDEFDVFVAFETMNNRGKNLSKLELLKNRLIYLTTLYPDSELDAASRKSLRDDINKAWKEVYYQLGRNEKRPLNDDDFLKAHWIMTFMYSRKKGDDYINFLLNEYFTPKNIHKKVEREVFIEQPEEVQTNFEFEDDTDENGEEELTKIISISALEPTKIKNYVNSLKASAVHWFNSHYPFLATENQLSNDERMWLDKLNRIGLGYFRPLVMSILKNQPKNADRLAVFQRIERFIFICFQLSQARRNYGDSEFYNAAREFDQKKLNINGIMAKLSSREAYSFNEDKTFKVKYFSDYMYKKFNIGGRAGYYSWHGLRYFLYEYELEKMKTSGQSKVDWQLFVRNDKDKISIEHIFPQTATPYWKNAFENIVKEERHIYSGSLGNLLLLSMSINASLQNDSYPEKIEPKLDESGNTLRKGYKDGSHSEIEVSLKYKEKWTPDEVIERGISLFDFMERRWNISLKDKRTKLKLLQIQQETEEQPQLNSQGLSASEIQNITLD